LKTYDFIGKVSRTILDTVLVRVRADSFEEAQDKAEEAVSSHPHVTVDDIPYCYIEQREYSQSDVLDLTEREYYDGA